MKQELFRSWDANFFPLTIVPTNSIVDIPDHCHDFIEIVIFQRGSAKHHLVTAQGTECRDTIMQGDCFAIMPGEIHGYYDFHQAFFINILMSPKLLEQEQTDLMQFSSCSRMFEADRLEQRKIHLAPYCRKEIDGYIQSLNRELALPREGSRYCAHLNLLNILTHILRQTPENNPNVSQKDISYDLTSVIAQMENEPQLSWSLDGLAKNANMCRASFTRKFRQATGFSPNEYLQALRLQKAASLLISTNLKLAELAEKCGFRDANYMIKVFSTQYNMTPNAYRQQMQLLGDYGLHQNIKRNSR